MSTRGREQMQLVYFIFAGIHFGMNFREVACAYPSPPRTYFLNVRGSSVDTFNGLATHLVLSSLKSWTAQFEV